MEENNEQLEKATVKQVSMKWGLYVGLVLIIYTIILYVIEQGANQSLGYVSYLFIIGGMVMAHKEFKSEGDGFMSYSQGLGIGTLLSLISGILSTVFSYIYITFIDNSILQQIRDQSYDNMLDQGMSDSEIETAMGFAEPFMKPEVFLPMALFFTVLVGFIIALVVSAITKNADPSQDL